MCMWLHMCMWVHRYLCMQLEARSQRWVSLSAALSFITIVYFFVYTCVCLHVHMCSHAYECLYVCFAFMCTCVLVFAFVWMHVRICVHTCACIYACVHVLTCVYLCACVHMCAYMCMHICACTFTHARACLCIYVCVYVCVWKPEVNWVLLQDCPPPLFFKLFLKKLKNMFYFNLHVCVCVSVSCAHRGGWETLDMNANNQTRVLCKDSHMFFTPEQFIHFFKDRVSYPT